MSNILFIFTRHSENEKDSTLTKDLSDEFSKKGHNVKVVTLLERKNKRKTEKKLENGYEVLRVKSGNYFEVKSKIEKGITILTTPFLLEKKIKEIYKNEKIDLIYTHTPFMSEYHLIKKLKKFFKCKACLHLWDIFPQNAKDLGIIKNRLLLKYFEKKEQKMYDVFDYIGCMSNGNLKYMEKKDKNFIKDKYFILKNWAKFQEKIEITDELKKEIRKKYFFNLDDFICVFGGNMGKPQKLENLLELADNVKEYEKIKFLFVGKGTEEVKLKEIVENKKLKNVIFLEYIPRCDYELLISTCDIGLVSLDERFTVPNYPSKTTDYLKLGLPILASLDNCSYEDYGKDLEEIGAGIRVKARDRRELVNSCLKLYNDKELWKKMSKNGREYYEKELGVEKAYNTIMQKIKGDVKDV